MAFPHLSRSRDESAITQHEVLRQEECDLVRDRVVGLRQHWIPRSPAGNFFTLGAAAYLDATPQREKYLRIAETVNPLLRENFGWLFERLRRGFAMVLGLPVSYDNEYALPGFHIFRFQGDDHSQDRPSGRAHFDLQWMHAMPARPRKTLSFTLLIEEPSGGSSMEIWPAHAGSIPAGFDALGYAAGHPSKTFRYSRGHMAVHDGLWLHAIGCASIAIPLGKRITLQGHGIETSEGWKLYW